MTDMEEYWDIYDRDKRPTGRIMKRNDWILQDGEYHLSVLAVIGRPDGRFLITKRVMTKEWAPGWWETPGGGVRAGEASKDAVRREVLEETGIDLTGCPGKLALTYHRENPGKGQNYFVDVYRFVSDFSPEEVRLQAGETSDFMLATLEEIRQLAGQGIFLHYDSICQVFETEV